MRDALLSEIRSHKAKIRKLEKRLALLNGVPEKKLPVLVKGHERKFCACNECGAPYFRDYLPYSLGNPVTWTNCGHSLGHRDLNVRDIDESEYWTLIVEREIKKAASA